MTSKLPSLDFFYSLYLFLFTAAFII